MYFTYTIKSQYCYDEPCACGFDYKEINFSQRTQEIRCLKMCLINILLIAHMRFIHSFVLFIWRNAFIFFKTHHNFLLQIRWTTRRFILFSPLFLLYQTIENEIHPCIHVLSFIIWHPFVHWKCFSAKYALASFFSIYLTLWAQHKMLNKMNTNFVE